MSSSKQGPVAPHPTTGVYEVLGSTFGPIVEGHFLVLDGNEEKLSAGRFCADPTVPDPGDLSLTDLDEVGPPGGRFVGSLLGSPCEVEVFHRGKRRLLVGKMSPGRPEVDIWVAEDDGGTFLPGDG